MKQLQMSQWAKAPDAPRTRIDTLCPSGAAHFKNVNLPLASSHLPCDHDITSGGFWRVDRPIESSDRVSNVRLPSLQSGG
jgi:hypothetical protein